MAVLLSKLTSKAQTVIPKQIRLQLDLRPGDVVRYRQTDAGVMIDKLPPATDEDGLAAFDEWASPADERGYAGL